MIITINDIIKALLLFMIWQFPGMGKSQSTPRYQETEGLVVIEIESAPLYGSWELETSETGYTGEGYLHYKGQNFYNTPGNSLLKFEIDISKTGKYRFQWHSKIAIGDSNTEHNDSWLRFHDASDFYGEKEGQRVYPKGTGKTPNPNGSSKDGWLKIYQNNQNNWTWVTRTSDHDPHDIFVEFETAGVYTLEISGRSNGHAINRLALYHSDVSASLALDLTLPESEYTSPNSTADIEVKRLKLRPTIAQNYIYVAAIPNLWRGKLQGQIISAQGQTVKTFSFDNVGPEELEIPIIQLHSGTYFVRLQNKDGLYQAQFIKP